MSRVRVLLVQDSPSDSALLEAYLTRTSRDFEIERAATLDEACRRAHATDCTLLDLSLPDSVGLRSVATFTRVAPEAPLIVLTGLDDGETGTQAVRLGAQDYLVKDDIRGDELGRAIRYAVTRKRTEAELRALTAELEQRSRELARSNSTIFDESPTGMLQVGADGVILSANPAMATLTGGDGGGLVGTAVGGLFHQGQGTELADAVDDVGRTGETRRLDALLVGGDGTTRLVACTLARVTMDESGSPVVLVSADDVTDERSAAIRQAHDQKLEELGRLAAGIAHEIRSPLQYVITSMGFVRNCVEDLLAARIDPDTVAGDLVEAMDEITEGITRIDEIVKGMNVLAHRAPSATTEQHLGDALGFPLAVARGQAPAGTEFVVETDETPPAPLSLGRVQQALLNVLVNAVHAIEDRARLQRRFTGRIEVRTTTVDDAIVVTVADNGIGMDAATLARSTEPFFTTKPEGRGTGQGLPLVRDVVDEHGGTIDITSTPGDGTVVTLRFPLTRPR